MKKFLFSLLLLISLSNYAQTEDNPIVWTTSLEKISDTEYNVILTASLLEDWHLYSQYNPKTASQALELEILEGETRYELVGDALESATEKEYAEIWETEEIFFANIAIITQRVKILDSSTTTITIAVYGQVCKQACIQVEESFSFKLNGEKIEKEVATVSNKSKLLTKKLQLDLKNTAFLETGTAEVTESGSSLFNIFLLGFVGGLFALLTPCVFPMIPLTVSFFTKQSQSKSKGIFNAILYGLFIVIIYILLSVPFHLIDGLDPSILNTISTNIWLNIFFFVILVFFSLSFFGFYEITLPSSWGTKMDSASDVGGFVGIFFMALTLAIVSFSCTGPI